MNWLRILKAPQRPKRRQPRPDSPEWIERLQARLQAESSPEPEPLADGFTRIDKTEAGTEVFRIE